MPWVRPVLGPPDVHRHTGAGNDCVSRGGGGGSVQSSLGMRKRVVWRRLENGEGEGEVRYDGEHEEAGEVRLV